MPGPRLVNPRSYRASVPRMTTGSDYAATFGVTGTSGYPSAQGACMSVVRTIVFPALRLLVWAVIAVALAVLAFRGGTGESGPAGPGAPTLDLGSPTVPVSVGTVANTVSVTGTVVADAGVPVKATAAGTVRRVLLAKGAPVASGQALVEIRFEEQLDAVAGTDAEGNPTSTPRPPRVRTATVSAPSAGTLSTLDVLVDQVVAVGDTLGTISPGTLSVTATLTQDEQFRLLTPPATAEVEVQGGPAPFTCTGLTLGAAPAAAPETPENGAPPAGGSGGGTTARCSVPAGVTVFAGMGATVRVQAGTADGVLVVPVTAVQGSVQTGNVWVVGDDGTEQQRAVTLGLTDGDVIEVREGLAEGEQVLQFVPVPDDSPAQDPMAGPVG
jgi:membrane fusion protein, multidrug efflux system